MGKALEHAKQPAQPVASETAQKSKVDPVEKALDDVAEVASEVLGDPSDTHSEPTSNAARNLKAAVDNLLSPPTKDQTPQVSYKAAVAEYLAMTLFVVIGCGSAMAVCKESGWVLQVALTFGLAISSLAYAVGHYSGGQINCAVTFGLVISKNLSVVQGLLNFAAQMLGSITGALILTLMIPEEQDKTGGLGTNKIADNLSKTNAFVGEFLMTFLLMFVVLETAVNPESKDNREMAALAIGFAVFLAHCVLINIDGCSINPTRTFGPALVRQFCYKNKANSFDEQWVFWAAPLAGAAVATFVSGTLYLHR